LGDSLKNSAWSGGVDADVWSSRIAELEERVVSAKRYAASMLEIAEKAERYAKEMGSFLGAGKLWKLILESRGVQLNIMPESRLRSMWPRRKLPGAK